MLRGLLDEDETVSGCAGVTVALLSFGPKGQRMLADHRPTDIDSGQAPSKLSPLYMGGGSGPKPTVDGIMATSAREGSSALVIMYRDASIAYYDDAMFQRAGGVPGTVLVKSIVDAVQRSADAIEWASGTLPALFEMSMYGVNGWQLLTGARGLNTVFDRELLRSGLAPRTPTCGPLRHCHGRPSPPRCPLAGRRPASLRALRC